MILPNDSDNNERGGGGRIAKQTYDKQLAVKYGVAQAALIYHSAVFFSVLSFYHRVISRNDWLQGPSHADLDFYSAEVWNRTYTRWP